MLGPAGEVTPAGFIDMSEYIAVVCDILMDIIVNVVIIIFPLHPT